MERDLPANLTLIHQGGVHTSDFDNHDKTTGFFSGEHAIMLQGMMVSTIMGALYYILNFLYEEIRRRIIC